MRVHRNGQPWREAVIDCPELINLMRSGERPGRRQATRVVQPPRFARQLVILALGQDHNGLLPPSVCPTMLPRRSALSLQQAVAEAPTLARLSEQVAEGAVRLAVLRPLLPAGLREAVRPGAPAPDAFSLLVPHNAAAAKLRQLVPALLDALQAAGHPVPAIRVKVVRPGP